MTAGTLKYPDTDLFKAVTGIKMGGCVCTAEQVKDAKKHNSTSDYSRSSFPYFDIINNMLGHVNMLVCTAACKQKHYWNIHVHWPCKQLSRNIVFFRRGAEQTE